MPTVAANRDVWDGTYEWPEAGEEWSLAWGSADAQWHFTLLPRISAFLPAPNILEIAPGFGRWSKYLIPQAARYIGVDLSQAAVDACRARYRDAAHAEFHVNDGHTLPAVPNESVDLAFSFDSLVHVEADVIASYLRELAQKLTADGVAFLHHSNLAACKPLGQPWRAALEYVDRMRARPTVGVDFWRGTSMSAPRFAELAADAGLCCIGQEVITWQGSRYLDCISMAVRPGSVWERPNAVVHNPYFMAEAASAAASGRVFRSLSERRSPAPGATPESPAGLGDFGRLGPLGTRIAFRRLGPWGLSVLGPLPRLRQFARRA